MNIILIAKIIFFIAACVYIIMAIRGVRSNRIYALGKWYAKSNSASQYWQVVIGYILFSLTLFYFVLFVLK